MSKRRVFIAVPIPEKLKRELEKLPGKWPGIPCRWIKTENLHLTVIPPIYLTDDELARMSRTVRQSAVEFPAFELGFDKIIYGPSGKPSRMIWLWGKPNEKLTELKNTASGAILATNIPYREEARPLIPHVTLCRINEYEWRSYEPKPKIDEVLRYQYQVDAIHIMESRLKRGGAEYALLEKIPLAKFETRNPKLEI
jgi:2'-5' RNA ligase